MYFTILITIASYGLTIQRKLERYNYTNDKTYLIHATLATSELCLIIGYRTNYIQARSLQLPSNLPLIRKLRIGLEELLDIAVIILVTLQAKEIIKGISKALQEIAREANQIIEDENLKYTTNQRDQKQQPIHVSHRRRRHR